MTDTPDEMDKLVADVRRMISDNRNFLDKLLDETEDELKEEEESNEITADDEFEEL